MNYKNIASILNTAIMKNATGEATTIAEDLSNIMDAGKLISAMTADQLKNFQKDLVAGVHTYVLTRMYERRQFKMYKDAEAYGGALSRVMASDDFAAQDSHLLNLENGVSYLDGKFYGLPVSDRVYDQTDAFKVVHSMSQDNYAQYFANPTAVSEYINMLQNTERRTVERKLEALEKRLLLQAIKVAADDNRKVQLVTAFNDYLGLTGSNRKTIAQIKQDRDLTAYFNDFCKKTIAELVDYVKDPNKKYNDGTVLTFTPAEKIGVVLLTQFATGIKYISDPIEFSRPDMIDYQTVPAWQNSGTAMLPAFDIASGIKIGTSTSSTTISNVVGFVYDVDGVGITTVANKATVEEVGSEGFRNLHHHLCNKFFVDSRLAAVVLTLD